MEPLEYINDWSMRQVVRQNWLNAASVIGVVLAVAVMWRVV